MSRLDGIPSHILTRFQNVSFYATKKSVLNRLLIALMSELIRFGRSFSPNPNNVTLLVIRYSSGKFRPYRNGMKSCVRVSLISVKYRRENSLGSTTRVRKVKSFSPDLSRRINRSTLLHYFVIEIEESRLIKILSPSLLYRQASKRETVSYSIFRARQLRRVARETRFHRFHGS